MSGAKTVIQTFADNGLVTCFSNVHTPDTPGHCLFREVRIQNHCNAYPWLVNLNGAKCIITW
jgi:uncharacterized protein YfdQ (DUF2303 family)